MQETERQEVGIFVPSDDDTEGHAARVRFPDPTEEQRIFALLKSGELDRLEVRLAPAEGRGEDTAGHAMPEAVDVLLTLPGEDDTEGHAISLHFPTADDARRFRNQLLATGLLAGTIVAGAGVGMMAGAPAADQAPERAQVQTNPNIDTSADYGQVPREWSGGSVQTDANIDTSADYGQVPREGTPSESGTGERRAPTPR